LYFLFTLSPHAPPRIFNNTLHYKELAKIMHPNKICDPFALPRANLPKTLSEIKKDITCSFRRHTLNPQNT
jgi:hypothetical protein